MQRGRAHEPFAGAPLYLGLTGLSVNQNMQSLFSLTAGGAVVYGDYEDRRK